MVFDLVSDFLGLIGANLIAPTTFLELFPWFLQWFVALFIVYKFLDMFSSWVALLIRGGNVK